MVCPHSYRTRRAERVERDGPIELVVFDMDGVLIDNGSSWVLVHRHFGVQNEGGLTRYLAGQIDDHEFVRTDVALWTKKGPVHTTMLDKILSRPDFMLGARETVKALHDHGMVTAIVSGGLDYMANRVAHALGIDDVYANGLHVDARGNITGEGILRVPLKDKSVPLPLLEAMLDDNGTALAQTSTPLSPLYVTWFFGNGSLPGRWKPASTGAG